MNRHAVLLLVVIVCAAISGGIYQDHLDDEARERDRTESARAYVLVLRGACEDRNVRDAKILAAVRVIADRLGADPADTQALSEALGPRDCTAIYPLPKPGEPAILRSEPATDVPRQPFASCEQAQAAGMTPLRKGSPGYNPDLDRDGDGLACE